MAYRDYLGMMQQQQQRQGDPLAGLGAAVAQGLQMQKERQAAQAKAAAAAEALKYERDRQGRLDKAAADKVQRDNDFAMIKLMREGGAGASETGTNNQTAEAYRQALEPLNRKYGLPVGNAILGDVNSTHAGKGLRGFFNAEPSKLERYDPYANYGRNGEVILAGKERPPSQPRQVNPTLTHDGAGNPFWADPSTQTLTPASGAGYSAKPPAKGKADKPLSAADILYKVESYKSLLTRGAKSETKTGVLGPAQLLEIDAKVKAYEGALTNRTANQNALASVPTPQATAASVQQRAPVAQKMVTSILGPDLQRIKNDYPAEYDAILQWAYQRADGKKVGPAPLSGEQIRTMRDGTYASKPAAGTQPAAKPSPASSAKSALQQAIANSRKPTRPM